MAVAPGRCALLRGPAVSGAKATMDIEAALVWAHRRQCRREKHGIVLIG